MDKARSISNMHFISAGIFLAVGITGFIVGNRTVGIAFIPLGIGHLFLGFAYRRKAKEARKV